MSAAVDEYVAHLRAAGKRPTTIATVKNRLRELLRTTDRDRPLRGLTAAAARTLFAARAENIGGETQHGELVTASAFARWCIARGWLATDPFAVLTPTKPRARGKAQLRIDEARQLVDVALAEDSEAGLAVATVLLLGLRASELVGRVVRDVDDGARVLWIERAKTAAGDRRLELPEVLQACWAARVAGRAGGEPLLPGRSRYWVYYHVRRLCLVAGVPVVCAHALRGTHASLGATEHSVEHVAAALGHASSAVTRRHYLADARGIDQRRALRVLAGGAV